MSPVSRSLVALVLLVAPSISAAGATAGSTTANTTAGTTIVVDGVAAGAVQEWEGGDPRASVVPGPTSSDGTATKQPGAWVCAPLVMKVPFPPSDPILELIGGLCSNNHSRKKILLTDFDAMGQATAATEFDEALIREVQFSALDASSSTAGSMTFVFDVERSRQVPPAAATASAAARATGTDFRLAVEGLDCTGVTRIEPITIRLGKSSTEVGATRDYTASPAQLELPNLTATLIRAKSSTWRTWFTDFVINGNSSDANEKNGALEFLSADMKQVVFALRFEHLGILRVSRVSAAAGAHETDQVELYFEKLSIGPPPPAVDSGNDGADGDEGTANDNTAEGGQKTSDAGADTDEESTADNSSTSTIDWAPAQETSTEMATGMLSDGTATGTSSTTALNLDGRITSTEPTLSGSTTAPTRASTVPGATQIVTNPADEGSRDPAGFPRVEGLTRVTFSGQYQETSTSEEARYTSPDKIYDFLARIEAAAKGAGWTQVQFAEGYSQGEKWVTEQWKKDPSYVVLEIDQPDTGITRYWIRVTTQIPEAN